MGEKEDILISVVIPLYNKEKEVINAIDSVFQQTILPKEIIVVDDGSTDNGPDLVLGRYGAKVLLIRQTNKGVSVARNTGIHKASSPFICLLDADDHWLPNHLEEIANLIRNFPSAVFYSVGHYYIDEQGKQFPSAMSLPSDFFGIVNSFAKTYSKSYGLINSSSVCVRKEFFEKGIHFPEGEFRGEDIGTWLKMGMQGPLAFSSKPLVQINRNSSNRSISKTGILPYQFKWYFNNKETILQHPEGTGIRRFIRKNAIITCFGLKLLGDKKSVKMIIKLFFRKGDIAFVALLPSIITPNFILSFLRMVRKSLRMLPCF
jgi:glycosyltransferase involved in cell wall biosynthesis